MITAVQAPVRRTRRRATLVALAAAGLLGLGQAASAAPGGYLNGWLPSWRIGEALAATTANADLFRTASPFWYEVRGDGTLAPAPGAGDPSVVSSLRLRGVAVVPTVTDRGLDPATAANGMADPAWRDRHVAALVGLVRAGGFDGIDLDYEHMGLPPATSDQRARTRTGYVALVRQLCATLHGLGKQCIVTVMPKDYDGDGVYDYGALGAAVDRFRLMTYDEHWATSAPGPIASLPWMERVVRYTLTKVPADRVELGVHTYGRDWGPAGSTSFSGGDALGLAAAVRATPGWDGLAGEPTFRYTDGDGGRHTVYYADGRSVAERVRLATRYGLAGVSLWSVSGAGPDVWPAVRAVVPTGPLAPGFPGTLLRQGSVGAAVAAVQRAVGASADGAFGPLTHAAVVRFQASHGLEADGVVGPATWAALFPPVAPAPPAPPAAAPYPGTVLRVGDRGGSVAAVQRALRIAADGVFGPQTLAAVRSFQAGNGLVADGLVGPATWAALRP